MSGYALIYRTLLDHTAFRNQGEAMAFAWLVVRASWQPTTQRYKDREIRLERGQLALSVRDMATHLDRSKDWANRFLERLVNRDMIATATATGVNVITICNYDKYQAMPKGAATGSARKARQDRDRAATQNNTLNEGNEEKGDANASPRRASRLPDDWSPGPLTPTAQKLVDQWPQGRLERELEGFKDYWSTRTRDAARADWDATWRNRIRDQHDRIMRENCNGKRHHPAERQSNWLAALNAERNSKRAAE